jgi:hypothetical protein
MSFLQTSQPLNALSTAIQQVRTALRPPSPSNKIELPNFSNLLGQLTNIATNLLQSIFSGVSTPVSATQTSSMMPTNNSTNNAAMAATSPDAPVPLITLMTYYKKVAEPNLGITPSQKAIIDPWVGVAKPKREQLEGEYAELRGELRDKMLSGTAPATETTALIDKMLGKERDILTLKADCARLLQSTLSNEQYAALIKGYNSTNGLENHNHM